MNRPYTVCHIFSALDGAITGSFMYIPETSSAREQYGRLRQTFESDAILYGTKTMLDFCGGYVGKLAEATVSERKDYIAPHKEDKYVVSIDRRGKLAFDCNFIERHGMKQHIIEVLTNNVSDAYINYLQKLGISYIFAGQNQLDCETAMIKLKEKFNITKLIIAGGGYIDWAFADAGMIDELSLVFAPAADGENNVTVFERSANYLNSAIAFTLKDVQKLEGNAVWLRYSFNNAKK